MADKTITVSLDFTANTSSAENSLRALQTSLQNISNLGNLNSGNLKISKEILEASEAAIQLRSHLQAAMDVKTGQLNLSKLDSELSKSGMKLSDYASKLAAIGPEGQQAFMQMANAVIASQTPLRQTTGLVDKLWDSLKRTAGWQISSTVIHGFMGAIQSAYGYAQDLNQSLNNIRIVTGASTDEMARFADKANKAAKALSSTTTDYTDAALIYYQQGIRDEDEIAQRTDTTIKLANVSRQSAEEVSSQMTAIWNNFADGSQNLEYYADVITKLGATTAASSSEIAGGMEKFAAVADTVGLSYEYAAASLATIVATTRQSEDTVGTGLRTIFSRLEGLKLGDTLEDGTDLNKYSQALATIGVNIKDASGNLKDMDTILDETAAKWDTLDQAQKVAFATTVGGVRQYTNLIALLDNWEMMEENIATARGSGGTLQEQQEIYAESWEAAQKRVRASTEALYTDLLNDKFFIGLTNGAAEFLDILDNIIDGVGGLGTVLPGLIILVDKLFGPKIQAGAKEIWRSLTLLSASGQAKQAQTDQMVKNNTIDAVKGILTTNDQSQTAQIATQEYTKVVDLQQKMVNNAEKMSVEEQRIAQLYIDRQKQIADGNIEQAKRVDLLKQEQELILAEASEHYPEGQVDITALTQQPTADQSQFIQDISAFSPGTQATQEQQLNILKEYGLVSQDMVANTAEANQVIVQYTQNLDNLAADAFPNLIEKYATVIQEQQEFGNSLDNAFQNTTNVDDLKNKITGLTKNFHLTTEAGQKLWKELARADGGTASFSRIKKAAMDCFNEMQKGPKNIKQIENALQQLGVSESYLKKVREGTISLAQAQAELTRRIGLSKNSMQGAGQAFSNFNGALQKGLSNFSKFAQGASTAVMAASMIKNAIETLKSPDATGWEKFSTIIMSLGMAVPVAVNAFNGFANAILTNSTVTNLAAAAAEKYTGAVVTEQGTIKAATAIAELEGLISKKNLSIKELIALARKKGAVAALAEVTGIEAETLATTHNTAVTWLNVAAKKAQTLAMLGVVGAVIAVAAAIGIGIGAFGDFESGAEKAEKRIQGISDASDRLSKSASALRDEVDSLNSALENIDSVDSKFDNLIQGTQEFSDALTQNQADAKKLIETCQLDDMDWYLDDNGFFHLTSKGQSKVNAVKEGKEEDSKKFDVASALAQGVAKDQRTGYAAQNIGEQQYLDAVQFFMANANAQNKGIDKGVDWRLQQFGEWYRTAVFMKEHTSTGAEGPVPIIDYLRELAKYTGDDNVQSTNASTAQALLKQYDSGAITEQEIRQIGSGAFNRTYMSDTRADSLLAGVTAAQNNEIDPGIKAFMNQIWSLDPALEHLHNQLVGWDVDTKELSAEQGQVLYDAYMKSYDKIMEGGVSDKEKEQYAKQDSSVYWDTSKKVFRNVSDDSEADISDETIAGTLAGLAVINDKDLINGFRNAFVGGLDEVVAARAEIASDAAGISTEDRDTFQQFATNIDWMDEEQIDLFRKNMAALTDATPEAIEEFINAIKNGAKKISDSTLNEDIDKKQERFDFAEGNLQALWDLEAAKKSGNQEDIGAALKTASEFLVQGGTLDIDTATQTYINAKNDLDTALNARISEDASKYSLNAEELSELTKSFQESNAELAEQEGMLENTAEAAEDAAVRYARATEAVEDLQKNSKDYLGIIQSLNKDSSKQNKIAVQQDKNFKALKKSIANLLNVAEDFVDVDFLATLNPKDLEKAATGDIKAIQRIRNAFIDYQAQLAGLADDPNLDAFKEKLDNLAEGAVIELDTDPFIQALIRAKLAAGAGATEIEDMLSGMQIGTDGIETFTRVVDQETYNAVVAAQGNSDKIAEALSMKVSDDEQIITDVDPQQFTSAIPEEVPFKVPYSVPQFAYTDTGGYQEAPPATGTLTFPGFRTRTEEIPTKDKKQHTIHGIRVKNGHKEYGGIGAPTKSSSGNGGGGGGGGGSKKSKEAPKADRGARYHNVTQRQSNNSRRQTENNRKKDRAFGKAQVELAREDLEIQKKKIELQEEYTKEISKNLKEDREDMKKQFEALKLPINFEFDEDGEIENYQEIIDALFEKEKALVEQYNSGGLDDEAFDEAKKKLDEAKEALGNYEETLELQKDELQTLEEYMEELADKALELTQIKFELNMSIIEDQLEWLDYSLSKIEDDAYSAAKAIALMGEQTSQYLKQGDVARAAISEILGRHGVNSIEELNGLSDSQIEALGFNKDEIEALKDYRSQLYESNQALLEMRRTITDKVLDTFDTFNEKVSESYEEFDKYNDVLEKYTDIVDLLGTKTDAATKRLVKTLRDTQLQNLRNQSVSAKEIYEGALANYNLAEKQYNDAVARYGANSIEAQQMEEIMKQAADARDDAYSNWLDAYQASLEKAREIYEAEMEELQKDFERSLTGIYGTFDLFDAAYERAKELKDNYLPEYEKIYELNKLNRDIQKEIDNSSSLRDKKALRQLQDEINRKQEAGVQLSKYEVEEMRKKFELEQARMNLEDARNSKSEVRLTRDQNGNWGYVYTASEDKVADAEQKYEDALYQYQKLSDDYITDLDEKIKDLTKNTQERLDEVREALEEGLIDIDQAEQQKQDILNSFYAQQSYLVSQFKGATDSLASSLGLMDELYGQQAELVDTLPETTFGQLSQTGSMEEWAAKSSEEILKYAEESAKAYERLQTTNQEIADQNKLNLSDIETATNNVAKSSEETQTKVSKTVQTLADSFKFTMGALTTWDQTYATTIQSAIAQNDLFITSLNNVIAKLGLIATYEMKDLYEYIDYLSAKGAKGETITEEEWKKLDEIRQKYAVNYSKESMAPFDTGGYTGEWGDEGKIAILHEKEYVLNADLTARFFDALKTFSLVDQFVNAENQIQQQKLQIETLETLSNYIDQLADRMNTTTINPNDFSASLFNSGNQQLEQNVHIEASFPNVTQSSEIEMAFDNLVNKASQYANRKDMSSMTFGDAYISKF